MLPLIPCFKVLPLVFDESLSYYEVLCKLVAIINDFQQTSDNNFNIINEDVEKIKTSINDLKNYVDNQDKKLSERIDLTQEMIDEKIKECHEHCELYAMQLYLQLISLLSEKENEIMQWVKGELAKIPTYLSHQFAITGDANTSGLQHDVKTILRENMFNFVDCERWNATFFDNLELCVNTFDESNKTAYEIDTRKLYDLQIPCNKNELPKMFVCNFTETEGKIVLIFDENNRIIFDRNLSNLEISFFVDDELIEKLESKSEVFNIIYNDGFINLVNNVNINEKDLQEKDDNFSLINSDFKKEFLKYFSNKKVSSVADESKCKVIVL